MAFFVSQREPAALSRWASLLACVVPLAWLIGLWLSPGPSLPPDPVEAEADGAVLVYQPPALFPALPSEPTVTPTLAVAIETIVAATPAPTHLSEAEMRTVLAAAGWPPGRDLEEALRVSYGESVGWQPRVLGDGGRAHGLFQIHADPWSRYCDMTPEQLLEAEGNARCARLIFEYEQARGYARWSNWSVKP